VSAVTKGRLVWLVMGAVLVTALVLGSRGSSAPPTENQRVHRIALQVRCPTCRELSAAESDAAASKAVRTEIRRRVRAGEGDGHIIAFLVSRYGDDILLKPKSTGVASLVWVLPVAALICALAGLGVAFRRWRARPGVAVSAEDRALVERELERT
jgi:cytochrome c-type biogenesis protein CcmH